jgi:excisionase family DNA binding protein
MTTREAAARLGCAERTVVLWVAQGKLKGKREGKAWEISAESVERRAEKRPHAAAPPPAPPAEADRPRAAKPAADRVYSYRNVPVLKGLAELCTGVHKALRAVDGVSSAAVAPVLEASMLAVQLGAAGYHAFVAGDKVRLYSRAREHAAMTAAGLWVLADLCDGRAEGLRILAASCEQAASALGGLMRKVSSHGA